MKNDSVRSLGQSMDFLERQLARMWRDSGEIELANQLSFNEYDYLKSVHELDSPRLSDLAKQMNVSKPSATTMVQKLEKRGLIRRSPCPEDGRAFRLSITPMTLNILEKDKEIYSALINRISRTLPEKELNRLEQLLSKVCDSISH
ncbi:MAG: MarR family winged helix-turn-helix transcriptional regulator [Endozoicomonas sp.]|uniref:MarR family winged helix-turn-helix transcriptional regulator n=1 Tax=Endozoicomonas sp. TaxID=1892382 RepID=UPI003D9B3BCC